MTFAFDDACRDRVAALCAAFERLPASESGGSLKRAAVAIALIESDKCRVRRRSC